MSGGVSSFNPKEVDGQCYQKRLLQYRHPPRLAYDLAFKTIEVGAGRQGTSGNIILFAKRPGCDPNPDLRLFHLLNFPTDFTQTRATQGERERIPGGPRSNDDACFDRYQERLLIVPQYLKRIITEFVNDRQVSLKPQF